MKIGVISDSHSPAVHNYLPALLQRAFAGVDLILHAGDIYEPAVLDDLAAVAPVIAVFGGGADATHTTSGVKIQDREVVEVEGLRIGMVHMLTLTGIDREIFPGTVTEYRPHFFHMGREAERIFGHPIDVVVFGDTHTPTLEWHDGVLLLNPGSPTLPRQLREIGTVGILEIEGGRAEARIISLIDLL